MSSQGFLIKGTRSAAKIPYAGPIYSLRIRQK